MSLLVVPQAEGLCVLCDLSGWKFLPVGTLPPFRCFRAY